MTPGHVPQFITNGVIGDGGPALEGKIKELGITNTGTPLCLTDGPRTGPYHQLCFGARTGAPSGEQNGIISYQAYGGAPPLPLLCNINGITKPCFGGEGTGGVNTPLSFGCKGDGATDDTSCMQSALDHSGQNGTPLYFDSTHLYVITSTLNITSPIAIEGPFRYGVWAVNQPTNTGYKGCTWGLTTRANITMIRATAVTGTIRGLCIDMSGDENTNPVSGAAISLTPPGNAYYLSGWHIEQNTILQPYDGIAAYGAGLTTECCGAGTLADPALFAHNTIVNPSHAAINIGQFTANQGGVGTVGISVIDNAIACKNAVSKAQGIGVALYEGAIWYDGTHNGPEGCYIGTAVIPGVVGGAPQQTQLSADGVFGDQSRFHDLLVQPNGGGIHFLTAGGKAPWAGATAGVNTVLIDCTNANTCQNFSFTGGIYHGGSGTNAVFEVLAGANGPFNLALTGAIICRSGPSTGGTGLLLNIPDNAVAGRWTITGNIIGDGCLGLGTQTGIYLRIGSNTNARGGVTITGNDLSYPPTPFDFSPSGGVPTDVIVKNNLGLDNVSTSVSVNGSTTSIAPSLFYGVIGISGSGNPTIIQLPPADENTPITFVVNYPGIVTFGPGGNICNQVSIGLQETAYGRWNAADNCWNMK